MTARPHLPLVEIAIEGRSPADCARLLAALPGRIARHPDCVFTHDPESGQTILGGASEAGLDALVDDVRACCAVRLGAPQVAYRETIASRVEIDHTLKRSTPPSLFARVTLVMEPGGGPPFTSKVVGGAVPGPFGKAVEGGVAEALAAGIFHGARVMDVAVTLVDGAWHGRDSSAEAFRIAGRDACREGLSRGGSALLEPVMRVEVVAPCDHAGAIVDDLGFRRARIDATRVDGKLVILEAKVPLANLFGYGADLRALTAATGSFEAVFHAFEPIPPPEPPGFTGAAAMRA